MSADTPLFSDNLIPADVARELPAGYHLRALRKSDYDKGFLQLLAELTTVGDISRERFDARWDLLLSQRDTYYIVVIEDTSASPARVVGTGAVVVEFKFIHNLSAVGHIEDVVVAKDQQGKKLGLRLINALDRIAQDRGCYKTILDCHEGLADFYAKSGLKKAGVQMAHKYEESR